MELTPRTFLAGWTSLLQWLTPRAVGKLLWGALRQLTNLGEGPALNLGLLRNEIVKAIGRGESVGSDSRNGPTQVDIQNIACFVHLLAINACAAELDSAGVAKRLRRQVARAEPVGHVLATSEEAVAAIVAAIDQARDNNESPEFPAVPSPLQMINSLELLVHVVGDSTSAVVATGKVSCQCNNGVTGYFEALVQTS